MADTTNENNLSIENQNPSEINMMTYNNVLLNNVEYPVKFDTEGLSIPIPLNDGTNPVSVYYQKIPKDILIRMIKEYLPGILNELNINKNNGGL